MRRTEKRPEADVTIENGFSPTRYWRPTEAWERAWRENLSRAPRRRSPEESQQIKETVYEWLDLPPKERPTLEEWRKQFDPPVTKQYLSRLIHTLPPRIALPPLRRVSIRRDTEATSAIPVRPVLDGHGWNCDCNGCRVHARIQAALREAKEN